MHPETGALKVLSSGNWRVQIRRKGCYASEAFRRRADAQSWVLEMERRADRGESVAAKHRRNDTKTFSDMIDIHIADLREVNKPLRRTKAYALERLRLAFGNVAHNRISRELFVNYGRKRAKEGAGPATVADSL